MSVIALRLRWFARKLIPPVVFLCSNALFVKSNFIPKLVEIGLALSRSAFLFHLFFQCSCLHLCLQPIRNRPLCRRIPSLAHLPQPSHFLRLAGRNSGQPVIRRDAVCAAPRRVVASGGGHSVPQLRRSLSFPEGESERGGSRGQHCGGGDHRLGPARPAALSLSILATNRSGSDKWEERPV